MGPYYYLVAQLPALSFGQAAPMTSARLRELCGELMSKEDAALLGLCVLDPAAAEASAAEGRESNASPLIGAWLAWERSLRASLARLRSQKLKRDAPAADPTAADAAGVAKAASAMESPLEAELFLDRSRWDVVEALQGYDYFGRDAVYGYLLRLLLLERKAMFRLEEGFAEYKAIYASVMEAAPNSTISGEPK